jgi:hypothetical protein
MMTRLRGQEGTAPRADGPAAAFALVAFILVLLAQFLPHGPRHGDDAFAAFLAAHVCGEAEWHHAAARDPWPDRGGHPDGAEEAPCPVCTLAKAIVLPAAASLPQRPGPVGTSPGWPRMAADRASSPAQLPHRPRAPPPVAAL